MTQPDGGGAKGSFWEMRRLVARQWDSSNQNTLLPSYGQDVGSDIEKQEVMKQRPGRPVADSDTDFVIPLTKLLTWERALVKLKRTQQSMSKSCIICYQSAMEL